VGNVSEIVENSNRNWYSYDLSSSANVDDLHRPLTYFQLFSERELIVRYMLSPVRLPSVVCNARAPYSGDCNFLQFLYGIWYRGHPLTSTDKNSSGDEIANVNFFYNIAHVEASAYAHW